MYNHAHYLYYKVEKPSRLNRLCVNDFGKSQDEGFSQSTQRKVDKCRDTENRKEEHGK